MKIKSLFILSIVSLILISCGNNANNSSNVDNQEKVSKEVASVCIWDGGSIRSLPKSDGKYLTKMALGEKITWLGLSEKDTTEKGIEYHKIRLSDGTEGWASEYVVVTDAKPGVIVKETTVYTRPNLLNSTNSILKPMDFVAILKNENGWSEIVGEKNKPKGWIQKNSLSDAEDDVAVALLANKALREKDEESKLEQIKAIIDNSSFANSTFIEQLRTEIEVPLVEVTETIDTTMNDSVVE